MGDKSPGLSIIAKDLRVEGTIHAQGMLVIAGELEGNLFGYAVTTVEGSRVIALAKVQQMVIAGEFEGDITVYESLRIRNTGVVSGKITCKNLTLEAGGKLEGKVIPLDSTEESSVKDTALAAGGISPASLQAGSNTKGKEPAKSD